MSTAKNAVQVTIGGEELHRPLRAAAGVHPGSGGLPRRGARAHREVHAAERRDPQGGDPGRPRDHR